jgi:DNA-binding transcriptional LysR family regulator
VSVVPDDIAVHEELLVENRIFLIGSEKTYNRNVPLIFREKGSATRLAMDKHLSSGAQRKRIELTSNEAVKQAVIAGLGYSLIPLIGTKNEILNKELHIIPLKSLPVVTHWRLIWLQDKKLSPVAQEYLRFVQESKEEIINKNFRWYLDYEPG